MHISGMPKAVQSIAVRAVDNPSPLVIPDSSSPSGYRILLAFRFPGNDSWCADFPTTHRCANSAIGIAEATHWDGRYTSTGHLTEPAVGVAIPYLGWEDPTLFLGANGSIHLLAHKYESGLDDPPGWPGLHAFSQDGKVWQVSKRHDGRGAYSFRVEWNEQRNATTFSRRERPELHVDSGESLPCPVEAGLELGAAESGSPLFLSTGVQYWGDASNGNDHRYSFVLVQQTRAGLAATG